MNIIYPRGAPRIYRRAYAQAGTCHTIVDEEFTMNNSIVHGEEHTYVLSPDLRIAVHGVDIDNYGRAFLDSILATDHSVFDRADRPRRGCRTKTETLAHHSWMK